MNNVTKEPKWDKRWVRILIVSWTGLIILRWNVDFTSYDEVLSFIIVMIIGWNLRNKEFKETKKENDKDE